MSYTDRDKRDHPRALKDERATFASHEFRLSPREWFLVCVIVVAVLVSVPLLWQRAEPFALPEDHRTPYELSEDYWLYGRLAREAVNQSKTLVIGDSVIWGQYVSPDQTLTHHLNARAGESRFANLGVNGTHPAALAGLIEYYCPSVADQRVLLHCNPLWLASPRHDLQTTKQVNINHSDLVAQFVPWISCYRATTDERVRVVAERVFPHNRWARHLRLAYLSSMDIPAWTIEHPRENPLRTITFEIPSPQDRPRRRAVSWRSGGLTQADFPWVDLDTSFQWRCFRRSVEILTRRGNEVFVCVGPLNEHMLSESSRRTYIALKRGIESWLQENGIPHLAPSVLPSDLYPDTSHLLSEGYALLARRLYENESFVSFTARPIGSAGGDDE